LQLLEIKRYRTKIFLKGRGMDEPGKVPACNSDRLVEVPFKITARRQHGNIVIDWSAEYGGTRNGNILTFNSRNREMFNLRFRIAPNDVGLRFPGNPLAAFWVAVDEPPSQAAYVRDYEPVSVSEDGQELLVLNINRAPANYCFAINFNSDCGPLRLISAPRIELRGESMFVD
jgi:hypothetical protein